ncbi:MAG: hypothetical protein RLY93_03415 [Sumerlaeia bacterium]
MAQSDQRTSFSSATHRRIPPMVLVMLLPLAATCVTPGPGRAADWWMPYARGEVRAAMGERQRKIVEAVLVQAATESREETQKRTPSPFPRCFSGHARPKSFSLQNFHSNAAQGSPDAASAVRPLEPGHLPLKRRGPPNPR